MHVHDNYIRVVPELNAKGGAASEILLCGWLYFFNRGGGIFHN